MLPLQGVGVLVTRPEQQCAPLCRMLEAQGASTWRLPAIEIRAVDSPPPQAPEASLAFDLILFTSANAVRFGVARLQGLRDFKLGAIGPATARALHQAGYQVAVQSRDSLDTEALLAHAALQQVQGQRVLLVKGRGGRRLLEEELARRGARVQCDEVYERVAAAPGAAALEAVRALVERGEIKVITATSVDIGARLLGFAPPALRGLLETLHWLVPGMRVAEELRARGLAAPMLIARSAEDQELVSALLSWRGAAPGA